MAEITSAFNMEAAARSATADADGSGAQRCPRLAWRLMSVDVYVASRKATGLRCPAEERLADGHCAASRTGSSS